MQSMHLRFGRGFRVAAGDKQSQAAQMVLAPGKTEGGPNNCHAGSDQWLYVVSGTGWALVAGEKRRLRAGSLLLIKRGEPHEIHNTGRRVLRTVNVYVPPAYRPSGQPLLSGKCAP